MTLLVRDVRKAMLQASAEYFNHPERSVSVIPVVGGRDCLNLSHHTAQLLNFSGCPTAVLGKTCHRIAGREIPATPMAKQSPEYFQLLSFAQREGSRAAVIEWSWGDVFSGNALPIDSDVLLLGQWELDHEGITPGLAHIEAMVSWIVRSGIRKVVSPAEDLFSRRLAEQLPEDVSLLTYGCERTGTVIAEKLQMNGMSCSFRLRCCLGAFSIQLPLPAAPNLMPVLGATGVAMARGAAADTIYRALGQMDTAPGCLEKVAGCGHLNCFVDSARTPKEIGDALAAVRTLGKGRVILVVGSPEGQDHSDRSHIVQVAEQAADHVILTSDNPGGESAETILQQMKDVATMPNRVFTEVDRRAAVYAAIGQMAPEDVLLVCGKGHEAFQNLGTAIIPWDDRSIIRQAATPRRLQHLRSRFVGDTGNDSQPVSRVVAS
jgi:UDP-N-acetylmuramoyl-L-alanyl-D-glutamate--2,6-diaminopimelate ligase